VSNIPSLCTHVIYAFATLDPTTYTMKAFDSWLDPVTNGLGNYQKFVNLKVNLQKTCISTTERLAWQNP
jgi:hypothetical protein